MGRYIVSLCILPWIEMTVLSVDHDLELLGLFLSDLDQVLDLIDHVSTCL
jgi:hypothetical protein